MTATADRAPTNAPAFAFGQGLPRDVVLRLLGGKFTRPDYAAYLRTDHWQATKASAMDAHGRACVLCDNGLGLQVHHRPSGYKNLFREDPARHLVVLCSNCHRRHHRR